MSEFLFDDFDEVSAKQWKQQIQFDLKGADYNETLVWQSLEGIHVKPFYDIEDTRDLKLEIPDQPTQWNVGQMLFIDDNDITKRLSLDAIDRGAEALYFQANQAFEYESLFNDNSFGNVTIYFNLAFISSSFLSGLVQHLSEQNIKAYFNIDILGNFARSGSWYKSDHEDHAIVNELLKQFPEQALLGVDATLYQNAGASMVQQLAYSLAHAHEYLANSSASISTITYKLAIGSNYFFEIAKLRALRLLHETLAHEYGVNTSCHIVAIPSKRNKTIYDYNLNMLRTTTECMSAVLGGANTVCNLAYDHLYHKSNEFGERISRNQLLILKAESYFDKVSNPCDGSYYIESLTQELAQKALDLFKSIEENGGFFKQLKEGNIQRKIKESATKEQQRFDDGVITLVGTNKYTNENDLMKNDLELYPFIKLNPRKTIIEPIIERRLSEKMEKQRLDNE